MSNGLIALVAATSRGRAERRLKDEPDLSLNEMVKECMRGAFDSGMLTPATHEELAFKGACAAAHGLAGAEGKEAIEFGLEALRALSAMVSGVPVDFEQIAAQQERRQADGLPIVPLSKLWDEVRQEGVWWPFRPSFAQVVERG